MTEKPATSTAARNTRLLASVPFGAQTFWLGERLFLLSKSAANFNTIVLPNGSYLLASALQDRGAFRAALACEDGVVFELPFGAILASAEEVL